MYIPPHFAVDEATATAFLSRVEAADLITVTEEGLVATFLPLIFCPDQGEHGTLIGHVARKNDQWRRAPLGDALVIAHGADGYVSPAWYPSKAEHGRVVPTWNYLTAHVYGELRVHDEPAWVDALVRRLTARHETGRPHPWGVEDAPARFHQGQLRAIVGLELLITRVEAKFKLSQNRSTADLEGVIAGLEADGEATLSDAVRRHRP